MAILHTPDPIAHGGALSEAIAKHGGEPSQWLDLSTGISPFSLPLPEFSRNMWRRLPEAAEVSRVCEKAMKYYGGAVLPLAVPGTQAAIQLLPFLRPDSGEVAIVSPTYGEYEKSFRRAGIEVDPVATLDAAAATRAGIVVLANPNNPDGRETMRDDVFGFVRTQRHRLVIVDEAFGDLRRDLSMTGAAGMEPNLLVMRSFGKFFGLAGLRLGFVFAEPALVGILADRLGPWAVSGPALAIADHAFSRMDLVSDLRERIDKVHGQTRSALNKAGVTIVGETPLFFCCEVGDGEAARDALASHQVLVRSFEHSPSHIRIGLVPDDLSAVRLRETLRLVLPRSA
ncbi:L-threonine-O-3-phosphate decarboxylase [Hoeflea phototrophica DFL-43]|uniref:threonine-phosphate decarboxylase n=1 Tax=Hoeflea phototrophica (strain DSM 17068 / NCIMB 14078 / DFL-43) TaxID=411684 RepID=A9DBR3_HOEPD|nr:threonine-phosphate decarboxylase CobD [Hoeflea phototrophica]EDQ32282.1 L-threonine-O-3-phosphate decarboxylase [Hoeflea phototrophica DFL-43]